MRDRLTRDVHPTVLTEDQLDAAKDAFLAAAAHHLETPMSAMAGIAELLRDRNRTASAVVRNRLVEMLAIQAEEAQAVVRNLILSARLDTGDVVLTRDAVDLREILETITANWESDRRSKLTINGDAVAVADRDGLVRALDNLLLHAETMGARDVSVAITRSPKRVVVEVGHDGEPLPGEVALTMLEPRGVHRGADGTPGFTIGLSVASRLAQAMAGELNYEVIGGRSVFELILPSALGVEKAGRGHIVLDPKANRPGRAAIEALLAGRDLDMAYQPVLHLATHREGTEKIVGYESLARFPNGSPQAWFDVAGNTGLRLDLELAAIEAAVAGFAPVDPSGFLAVNLSDGTLTSSRLHKALEGVDPGRVVLELSEEAVIRSYEVTNRAVDVLRERGYRLAIDDVGMGELDLWHILRLDPAVIKIDLALVRDLEDSPRNAALVRAITAMARDLGTMVIAEGIESERERDRLCELGVEYGQGYLLGKPKPLG